MCTFLFFLLGTSISNSFLYTLQCVKASRWDRIHNSRISSFVLQNKLSYNLTATPSRVFQETVEEVKRSIPSIRPARRWVLIQKRIAAKVQSSGSRSIFLDDRCQFISILPGFRSYQECPCDNSIIIITITLRNVSIHATS